jgi:S1-C subfamily serine protease
MKKLAALALFALSTACQGTYDKSEMSIPSAEEVVYYLQVPEAKSRESVISIDVILSDASVGSGTGAYVRYKDENLIITAAHVVEEALIILISSHGQVAEATVILLDKDRDLAILRVPTLDNAKPIRLVPTSARSLTIGEDLLYTGFPNRFGPLTIRGNIAAFYGTSVIIMQSYAWSGASGSLVLDRSGNVVGILTAIEILQAGKGQLINNPNIVYVNVIDKQFLDVLDDILD